MRGTHEKNFIQVKCPNCGTPRQIYETKASKDLLTVRCLGCKQRFPNPLRPRRALPTPHRNGNPEPASTGVDASVGKEIPR
jgi:hypothetical protein